MEIIAPSQPSRLSPKRRFIIAETRVAAEITASNDASAPEAESDEELSSLPFLLKYFPSRSFAAIAEVITMSVTEVYAVCSG